MKPSSEEGSYNLIVFMEVYHDRRNRGISKRKKI